MMSFLCFGGRRIGRFLELLSRASRGSRSRVCKLSKGAKEKILVAELKKLEAEDQAGRKEIKAIVAAQLKEKKATTDRSVEKFKLKTAADEKKDMQRLLKIYIEKSASNQAKNYQGIQVLRKRHVQETQKVMQQHRQRRFSRGACQTRWLRLSGKKSLSVFAPNISGSYRNLQPKARKSRKGARQSISVIKPSFANSTRNG
jgi:hypothetical protein